MQAQAVHFQRENARAATEERSAASWDVMFATQCGGSADHTQIARKRCPPPARAPVSEGGRAGAARGIPSRVLRVALRTRAHAPCQAPRRSSSSTAPVRRWAVRVLRAHGAYFSAQRFSPLVLRRRLNE